MRRATIYLNLWMAVHLELEHALELCKQGDVNEDDYLYAWDKAVAFYTGSIAKQANGNAFEGYSLYTLAKERCMFSATCSDKVTTEPGITEPKTVNVANVNEKIFQYFNQGQQNLLDAKCVDVAVMVQKITQQMSVPLLQGILHFAYSMDLGNQQNDDGKDLEAEGAVFSASVLPLIHHCNADDAGVLYEHMRTDNGVDITDFKTVMEVMERNLECLGITCQDLGGVADVVNDDRTYLEGGEPCHYKQASTLPPGSSISGSGGTTAVLNTSTQQDAGPNVGLAVGMVVGLVVAFALITALVSFNGRSQKEYDGPNNEEA